MTGGAPHSHSTVTENGASNLDGVTDKRASWWTRWPDEDAGPLWVGLHMRERWSSARVVGVEVWTEEPGTARSSLGPGPESPVVEMVMDPVGVRGSDLRLHLPELVEAMKAALASMSAEGALMAANLPSRTGGRPVQYGPDHYERVAGVMARAGGAGGNRMQAVVDTWSVSRSTAYDWVMTARTMGLLPTAEPRT